MTENLKPDFQQSCGTEKNLIAKLLDLIANVVEAFGATLICIMTLVVLWQIVARFRIVHFISPWTEEVAIVLLVWFGMTGAAIGVRKNLHIGVEFVTNLFSKPVQMFLTVIVDLLLIGFSTFLLIKGIQLAWGAKDIQLTALLISRGLYVYSAAPVSAFLLMLFSLELLIKDSKSLLEKLKEERS